MLSVGSLFSGIGGFDLGLERAGMRVAWQCEADEFCRRVLARHWPDVPCYSDVRDLRGADVEPVDVLCGGFPCQPVSSLGAKNSDEHQHWLWPDFARLVGELRPRYVVVENVAGLRYKTGGLGTVLGDLASLGYDAEWESLPAGAFGAHHRRERIWIVAYPQRGRRAGAWIPQAQRQGQSGVAGGGGSVFRDAPPVECDWPDEPSVGRVADGVPARVDRLRSLGNALVPICAEWVGRRILDYERGVTDAAA